MKTQKYFDSISNTLRLMQVTDCRNNTIHSEKAVNEIIMAMNKPPSLGHRVFFIGNGGSAGITSHMAIDYTKNGNIRAMALNDASALTCLSNDYSYEEVFSKQIEYQARKGDIMFAISSSGNSKNILNACLSARNMGCIVYTLSGFGAENKLRKLGDLNFYVPAKIGEYGFVEVAHTAILHCILDLSMGWGK